jgi:glycosidase
MTYGWKVYQAMKKIWSGDSTVSSLDRCLKKEATKYPANYRALRFITNHDEDSWDDVPEVKFTNRDGAKAAFITMITLPGTPLVYNGQEVGYPTKINLFEKYSIDYSVNPELQQWYSNVLNFYDQNDILKKGTLDEFDTDNPTVFIYERQLLGKDPLWVIVNTKNAEVTAKLPPSLQNKKLMDLLGNEGIVTEANLKLRPFEYHIVQVK